ncbi:MAG: tRNA (adenosine(37)-N6)-threonylcarbamoyltransferase complex dimerization subunit type 1 TsaB [candidate division FCPU426 bacterium]
MIFGLDTSTNWLSLALRQDGRSLAHSHEQLERRHNEAILPALERLLAGVGRPPKALQGIVVGMGPGSFTGVRVGIATALGLAQALDIPAVGISSFLAVAAGTSADRVLVLADALQEAVYAAAFQHGPQGWETLLPEQLCYLPDLPGLLPAGPWAVAGPGARQFFAFLSVQRPGLTLLPEDHATPSAEVLTRLADGTLSSPHAGQLTRGGMPLGDIKPIYLRKTQAEELRDQRQRATDPKR